MSQWDARMEQMARLFGFDPSNLDTWVPTWTHDPRRALDVSMQAIASYLRPDDVVVDVGGGSGRVALPLAPLCREVVVVDRSSRARALFEETATAARITNVRFVVGEWPEVEGVEGEVVLVIDALGSNRDIVSFVKKLAAAARRRVIIQARGWRNHLNRRHDEFFSLLWGEEYQPLPGYEELLPVLWEMGVFPDVRMLPPHFLTDPSSDFEWLPQTQEEAIEQSLRELRPHKPESEERARAFLRAHFDDLYVKDTDGFLERSLWEVRYPLITWATSTETETPTGGSQD